MKLCETPIVFFNDYDYIVINKTLPNNSDCGVYYLYIYYIYYNVWIYTYTSSYFHYVGARCTYIFYIL